MTLAIREQIFGIESNIDYLQPEDILSFDKRKGQKAQRTKAIHQAVIEQNHLKADHSFTLEEFETYVTPSSSKKESNMKVIIDSSDSSVITVRCDASKK